MVLGMVHPPLKQRAIVIRRSATCSRAAGPGKNPMRQGTGALQDTSHGPVVISKRASVLDCGGPPPLFHGGANQCESFLSFAWATKPASYGFNVKARWGFKNTRFLALFAWFLAGMARGNDF